MNRSLPQKILHEQIDAAIKRLGDALQGEPDKVRVAAARAIVGRRGDLYNRVWAIPLSHTLEELRALEASLLSGGIGREDIELPYDPEGIVLAALVEIEQIARDAMQRFGWSGKDLRALGLKLCGGGRICWLTTQWANIRSATGRSYRFYPRH